MWIYICSTIPVNINGLTSVEATKKIINHKKKNSAEEHSEHKIVISVDSHARGFASNVKHNLSVSYKS